MKLTAISHFSIISESKLSTLYYENFNKNVDCINETFIYMISLDYEISSVSS